MLSTTGHTHRHAVHRLSLGHNGAKIFYNRLLRIDIAWFHRIHRREQLLTFSVQSWVILASRDRQPHKAAGLTTSSTSDHVAVQNLVGPNMAALGAGSLVVAKDGNVLAVFALDLAVIGLLFHGIILSYLHVIERIKFADTL